MDRDDDVDYSVNVPIDATGADAGIYTLDVKVYRSETTLMNSKQVTLTVEDCSNSNSNSGNDDTTSDDDTSGTDDSTTVVVTPGQGAGTGTTGGQYPVVAIQENDSDMTYVILLTIAIVVLVALIIWIIALLFRK